jgi:pantoate--beta-alanine ligase
MKTVKELPSLRALVHEARSDGASVALVPTMGALHEGHLSLVRLARKQCGLTVVSIFVNPLQFSPGEDFERYPRREADDATLLATAGADLLYLPAADDFYPRGFSTAIEVAGVSSGGEGAARPGHFRGVATAVAKLFLQVQPDAAFFGRKDLQQVAVIRKMARDLDFPISIEVGPTVREPDGLALSSRNAYLSSDERRRASGLSAALFAAERRAAAGERDVARMENETRGDLAAAGLAVDYVEVVLPDTFARPLRIEPGAALCAAVRAGKTRLIDNVLLLDAETGEREDSGEQGQR